MEQMKTVTLEGQQFEIVDAEARREIQEIIIHGGDKTFVFEQATPSNEWTAVHNLNKYPSVTAVIDSAGTVVEGDYEYIDVNTVKLYFSGAFAGKAFFN